MIEGFRDRFSPSLAKIRILKSRQLSILQAGRESFFFYRWLDERNNALVGRVENASFREEDLFWEETHLSPENRFGDWVFKCALRRKRRVWVTSSNCYKWCVYLCKSVNVPPSVLLAACLSALATGNLRWRVRLDIIRPKFAFTVLKRPRDGRRSFYAVLGMASPSPLPKKKEKEKKSPPRYDDPVYFTILTVWFRFFPVQPTDNECEIGGTMAICAMNEISK